jgi:hypothetical protein
MMGSQECDALNSGERIIFGNKVMLTTAINLTNVYSVQQSYILIQEKLELASEIAMLGSVSIQRILGGWLTRPRSIDDAAFFAFSPTSSRVARPPSWPFSWTTPPSTTARWSRDSWMNAASLASSTGLQPQYKSLEIVWSQVKEGIKRVKLEMLTKGASINN